MFADTKITRVVVWCHRLAFASDAGISEVGLQAVAAAIINLPIHPSGNIHPVVPAPESKSAPSPAINRTGDTVPMIRANESLVVVVVSSVCVCV